MSNGSEGDASALQRLSALADGELDPSHVAAACAAWREDVRMRAAWHAYHLIGDVLRSEDLAALPVRDAALVDGLRARLATEPIVLAPEPLADTAVSAVPPSRIAAHGSGRWAWKAPSAVAAGFVLVAGALVMTRTSNAPVTQVARAPSAQPVAVASTSMPPAVAPSFAPVESAFVPRPSSTAKLVRDARLDRYLAAHQQFAGSSALGVPSGFLRNAAAEAPSR
jgi:sigma-E factor negative regulatory protein RseA